MFFGFGPGPVQWRRVASPAALAGRRSRRRRCSAKGVPPVAEQPHAGAGAFPIAGLCSRFHRQRVGPRGIPSPEREPDQAVGPGLLIQVPACRDCLLEPCRGNRDAPGDPADVADDLLEIPDELPPPGLSRVAPTVTGEDRDPGRVEGHPHGGDDPDPVHELQHPGRIVHPEHRLRCMVGENRVVDRVHSDGMHENGFSMTSLSDSS